MSENIWIISDTHFGHNNIINYCDRPFSNVKEMNEAIIDNWNSVVKQNDLVYHL
jgi:calcineurin-like phosphoesterase family protein